MGKLTNKPDSPALMPDSIRHIGSVSKLFTATAFIQLVEKGLINISDPVMSVLPEFNNPMLSKITPFHLLTHTSGLTADSGYFLEPYMRDIDKEIRNKDWLKAVLKGPLQSKPGEVWSYCSIGFMILAKVVSRLNKISFEDYVVKNILQPLGMERSFYDIPKKYLNEVCYTLDWEENLLKKWWPAGPPRGWAWLHTTLHDLWKFSQMMLNKGELNGARVLSRKSVEAMTRNQLQEVRSSYWGTDFKALPYGLGWSLVGNELMSPGTYNHEGWGRCGLYIDPAEQLIFIYFVPTTVEAWFPESIVNPRNIVWSGIL